MKIVTCATGVKTGPWASRATLLMTRQNPDQSSAKTDALTAVLVMTPERASTERFMKRGASNPAAQSNGCQACCKMPIRRRMVGGRLQGRAYLLPC